MSQQEGVNISLKITKTRISNRNVDLKPTKSWGKTAQNIIIGKFDLSPKQLPKICVQKMTSPKMGRKNIL